MPPRVVPLVDALQSLKISPYAPCSRHFPKYVAEFSTTSSQQRVRENLPRAKRWSSPFYAARALRKRTKNEQRQKVLKEKRAALAVHPVFGHTTPFLKSVETPPDARPIFDLASATAGNDVDPVASSSDLSLPSDPASSADGQKLDNPKDARRRPERLNFGLTTWKVNELIKNSRELLEVKDKSPFETLPGMDHDLPKYQGITPEHQAKAQEAITRILSLANATWHERTKEGKATCVDTFGRHRTDIDFRRILRRSTKTPRVGLDTGSSEVQAAVLTLRIRRLAETLHGPPPDSELHQQLDEHGNTRRLKGWVHKDKQNKDRLRKLCHKRQKHLRYLKRKEKGGIRYQNVMEMLGLDEKAIMEELFM